MLAVLFMQKAVLVFFVISRTTRTRITLQIFKEVV